MKEVEVKYKWQRDLIAETEKLSFDELVDELVNVAQLGDRMEHRDDWTLAYLIKYLKEMYESEIIPEKTMHEISLFYKCTECGNFGFPSIFGDMCTVCANKKRGL